jgi:DUF4097 and DUF4098 domain-containing protein YvlB
MNSFKQIILTVAAVCTVVGSATALWAFSRMGWQIGELETVTFSEKTTVIDTDFDSIQITDINAHISLYQSQNGECKAVFTETEHLTFDIQNNGGTLTIEQKDDSKWYERFGVIVSDTYYLKLYLPKAQYSELTIESVSGDAELTSGLDFGDINISTVSGEIILDKCDGVTIDIATVSGDVKAHLLTDKTFYIDTDSGTVNVPESVSGAGDCRIDTTSGDIHVTVG